MSFRLGNAFTTPPHLLRTGVNPLAYLSMAMALYTAVEHLQLTISLPGFHSIAMSDK